jgi:5-methylcytosine-specific restriction endonuclease McrA
VNPYSLSHLSDPALVEGLKSHLAHGRDNTALVLAHIAEVDARALHVPAGYPSMYLYCVDHLHMSEDEAFRRIRAARAGREFPAVFLAEADGRLHLSAVSLLAPHLNAENAGELIAAATHKSKAGIEHLLAQRFPRPDVPTLIATLPESAPSGPVISDNQLVPGRVDCHNSPATTAPPPALVACGIPSAPARMDVAVPPAQLAPLAPERFKFQCTIDQSTHDLLRQAQALLGHQVPAGDVAQVLHRALTLLVHQLEPRKFAATEKPRPGRGSRRQRHIPAEVKRAVWKRDGARCAFVSDDGQRCPETSDLEFDHMDPVARGGRATVDRMRLLCRAHNQHVAERSFGTQFMIDKRRGAQRAAVRTRAQAAREAVAADRNSYPAATSESVAPG